MDAARYAAVQEIFVAALGRADDEREAFLDRACADDPALRDEVLALLQQYDADEATRDHPFSDVKIASSRARLEDCCRDVDAAPASQPDVRIPGYRIVRQIGAGGMGVVFEAEQASPRRSVAIKLLHPFQATPARLARLRHEAELLGRLQHPNIAQVYEAGTFDLGRGSQPFFAMELIDGVDLRTYCERERLDDRARLELLARVAEAMEHAHQRGVIHRDLKPENILVDKHGQPKVLDFGIARATDGASVLASHVTQEGQLLGTLAYMAPEQIRGEADAISQRTDVYALGVVGFELTTGALPFSVSGHGLSTAIRVLQDRDAPRLGTLNRRWRGDVEAMIGRALEKNPARRYATAGAFAADLRRWLAGEPILARRIGRIERSRRFVRRHRTVVAATTAVMFALAVGLGWALVERAESIARESSRATQAYRASLIAAAIATSKGRTSTARRFLADAPVERRGWEFRYLIAQLDAARRQFTEPSAEPQFYFGHHWSILDLIMSPDGRTFVTAGTDGTVLHRDARSGEVLRTLQVDGYPERVAMSDDGRRLVMCVQNPATSTKRIETHDLVTGGWIQKPLESSVASGAVVPVEIDPERGRVYVLADDRGEVVMFDLDGREIGRRRAGLSPGSRSTIRSARRVELVLSPDRSVLAACERPPNARAYGGSGFEVLLLDPDTLQVRGRLEVVNHDVRALAFSPDNTSLCAVAIDGVLCIWDVEAALASDEVQPPRVVRNSGQGMLIDVAYSGDSVHIVTAAFDRTVHVRSAATGETIRRLPSHDVDIEKMTVVPGSDEVLTVDQRGAVRCFDLHAQNPEVLTGHASFVYAVDIDHERGLILSGGWDGYVGASGGLRLWDLASSAPVARFGAADERVEHAHFFPEQALLLTALAGPDGTTRWVTLDLNTGERRLVRELPYSAVAVACSRIRPTVWIAKGADGSVSRVELESGDITRLLTGLERDLRAAPAAGGGGPLALSPDERHLAVVVNHEEIRIVNAADGALVRRLAEVEERAYSAAFDPTGRRLITAWESGRIRVHDVETGAEIAVLEGHDRAVLCAAFDPTGVRIASGGRDNTLRIWDAKTYQQLVELEGHDRYVYRLAWEEDGERLITASGDHTARIWEPQPRRVRLEARSEYETIAARLAPMLRSWLDAHPRASIVEFFGEHALTDRERQIARQLMLKHRLHATTPAAD